MLNLRSTWYMKFDHSGPSLLTWWCAMYEVTGDDKVIVLKDVPQSSVGAPCPMVIAGEHAVAVCFYLQNVPAGWDGTSVRMIDPTTSVEPAAVVRFLGPMSHMFGPPNDEAFSGHPLAPRGLHPYGAFEVIHSSWINRLERMNAVHPYHRRESYERLRHFILSFHDTTFECVARSYVVEPTVGSVASLAAELAEEQGA